MQTRNAPRESQHTSKIVKNYDLSITITRHGPKESFEGPLSEEGKSLVHNHYSGILNNTKLTSGICRKVVSSPIHRAKQTAQIYKSIIEKHFKIESDEISEDERLSEKNLLEFIDLLPPYKKDDWFRYWYTIQEKPGKDVPTGNDAVRGFADWILEQLDKQRESGGVAEIDAFSHGPVMAAFMLKLEEILGVTILSPNNSGGDRLRIDKLFAISNGDFKYLSNINIQNDSKHPGKIKLNFKEVRMELPLAAIIRMRDGV
jgi:broad specificity phosphatase PhoE